VGCKSESADSPLSNGYVTLPNIAQDSYGFPNEQGLPKLYSDVDESVAGACSAGLVRQSLDSFRTPTKYSAPEVRAPKFYVVCEKDAIFPFDGQQAFAGAMNAKTLQLGCGHSPFLKEAENEQLIRTIIEAAEL
jgi:pimeloyl-ACP methyl ester carboxylesterase